MPERCNCGDTECPKCYPGTWERNRKARILNDAGLLCRCGNEIYPSDAKRAYGKMFCSFDCLVAEFNERKEHVKYGN